MDFGFIFDKAKEAVLSSDELRTFLTAVVYEGIIIGGLAAIFKVREDKKKRPKTLEEYDSFDVADDGSVILSNEWGW